MHPHHRTIERFFLGLGRLDAGHMVNCLAPDAEYWSLAIGRLSGERVPAFWRLVCARDNLRRLRVEHLEADDYVGRARWSAQYACGRLTVRQVTDTVFRFRRGRILRQEDRLELCPGGRTIGSEELLQEERAPLLMRLRARVLVSIDDLLAREAIVDPPSGVRARLRSAHGLPPRRREARAR